MLVQCVGEQIERFSGDLAGELAGQQTQQRPHTAFAFRTFGRLFFASLTGVEPFLFGGEQLTGLPVSDEWLGQLGVEQ